MAYTKQTWADEPTETTPLSAARLGVIEDGIEATAVVADAAVTKATYDAHTVLYATADNTPVALTVGASTIVGRKSSGNIVALTGAETLVILGVTAAGLALVDDADNTAQRTTLGLGTIATQAASSVAITGGTISGITTTKKLLLPIQTAVFPDQSGTGNNAPALQKVVSSGTQTTNTPKVTYEQLLFDGATDESIMWAFALPTDYISGGTLRLTWGNSTTTPGNVVWKAGIVAGEPVSTDMDAAVFVAADVSTADAAPTTVGHVTASTIALTVTGLDVAGGSDMVVLFVGRDADNASDTLDAIDAILTAVQLEYVGSL